MTVIVIDLEWSQPMSRDMILKRGDKTLPVEIIQIGAIAVKDGRILDDTFSSYVRPLYYKKIGGRIQKLTGIREEMLRGAGTFPTVMKKFEAWCRHCGGEIFAMWGNEDVRFLFDQCRFYGMEAPYIKNRFNLQPIFTRQFKIQREQIGLNTAVELAGIDSALNYHSAINDAYYTALILQKINDLPDMIAWQKKVDRAHAEPIRRLTVTRYSQRDYSRVSSALTARELRHCLCPICGRRSNLKGKLVCVKPRNYLAVLKCSKHDITAKVTFQKTDSGRFIWKRELSAGDAASEKLYASILRRNEKKAEQLAAAKLRMNTEQEM